MWEWFLAAIVKQGFAAFFGFIADQLAQAKRDADKVQEGRRQQADDQAAAGAKADAAVADVADHPPTEDDVFGRLDGGTA